MHQLHADQAILPSDCNAINTDIEPLSSHVEAEEEAHMNRTLRPGMTNPPEDVTCGNVCRVLVTGASGGIGKAVTSRLALAGAKLLLQTSGKSVATASDFAESVIKLRPNIPIVREANFSSPDEAANLVLSAFHELGGLDAVVMCHGEFLDRTLDTTSIADWKRILDVNVTSSAAMLQELAALHAVRRHYEPQATVVCIVISSRCGLHGSRNGTVAYAASKGALNALVKTAARTLIRSGIRLTAILPGLVDTSMLRSRPSYNSPSEIAKIAANRLATPDEIAAAVISLLGTEFSYAVGSLFEMDGGM